MAAFLAQFGVTPAEMASLKVSLFCYPHAPVVGLVRCMARRRHGNHLPGARRRGGRSGSGISWREDAKAGAARTRGALTVRVLPFVAQPDYDKLLWACDLNFVRGEDSFVRAQWAGKPFIWHIYPQDENLHHKKLRAFLQRYAADIDSLTAFSLRWNGATEDVGRASRLACAMACIASRHAKPSRAGPRIGSGKCWQTATWQPIC